MPASRSPRHRVWSSILVVPTAQQLNPDGCQGEILLSLCTRFTDLSPRAHIPANGREGGREGETVNLQLMSSSAIFFFIFFLFFFPWRKWCKSAQFSSVLDAQDRESVCRCMPVGQWHTRARRHFASHNTIYAILPLPKGLAPGQPADLLWPRSPSNRELRARGK